MIKMCFVLLLSIAESLYETRAFVQTLLFLPIQVFWQNVKFITKYFHLERTSKQRFKLSSLYKALIFTGFKGLTLIRMTISQVGTFFPGVLLASICFDRSIMQVLFNPAIMTFVSVTITLCLAYQLALHLVLVHTGFVLLTSQETSINVHLFYFTNVSLDKVKNCHPQKMLLTLRHTLNRIPETRFPHQHVHTLLQFLLS